MKLVRRRFACCPPLLPLLTSVRSACLLAVLAVSLSGCDSFGLGRIVPVKGQVTLDGKPLTTGSLVFKPDAAKGNQSKFEPASSIGADGSYSLFTKEKEGAPLGWYNVGIVAQEAANPADPYAAMKPLVPARYNDAETSGVSVEVVASPAAGAYDLKLTK
jgi:hypothetical protein